MNPKFRRKDLNNILRVSRQTLNLLKLPKSQKEGSYSEKCTWKYALETWKDDIRFYPTVRRTKFYKTL